jgi:acetylglutamate kinase
VQTLHILKIGGKVVESDTILQSALNDFLQLPGQKILVHGGGKRASELGQQLGIPAQMIDGRRVTDAATLEIVTMVYAGLYNKKVVAQLQAKSCNAIGLSGADGNLIQAHQRSGWAHDYGFAGDIDSINSQSLSQLLQAGFTPVLCAITHNRQGQLLNTNADTIAASVAEAMSQLNEVHLHLCLDLPGVMRDPNDPDSTIASIQAHEYQHYQQQGIVSGGMIPKLDNAFAALNKGVKQVRICGPTTLATGGTLLKN